MNIIILVFLLLSPLFVSVGIVLWKLNTSDEKRTKTLGEEVQEFLGDVQEYQEYVQNKKAQFSILYDKAHAVLGYLLMMGDEDETIAWARHMYNLGFMHETMVYAVFSQYGNVFEEEESTEPIQEYAIEVLSNLIESKEKEDIRQLVAEMQALGWFDASSEEYLYLFGRLCELGIDINNCYKE